MSSHSRVTGMFVLPESSTPTAQRQHFNASLEQNSRVCFHCLEETPKYTNLFAEIDGQQQPMCCTGCKAAAEFISARGLERFYEHRSQLTHEQFFGQVGGALLANSDLSVSHWRHLDDAKQQRDYLTIDEQGTRRVRVLIDGMYCRSCSWLIERAIKSTGQGAEVQIDIAARSMSLKLDDPSVKMAAILDVVEQLGYRLSVLHLDEPDRAAELERANYLLAIRRIAVAGLGMMQVMTYATAGYFSDASNVAMSADYARFFLLVSMLVATAVVFYSGRPFFCNAMNDLRNRHLGMDVPIALAIAAAYFPSVAVVIFDVPAEVYFDSAVMFVFFLSLGRFFESRARHKLSGAGDSVQNLLPRMMTVERLVEGQTCFIDIAPRDVLVGDKATLGASDILAFDGKFLSGEGHVDEALVTGEAEPKMYAVGEVIYAGSRLLSGTISVEAIHDWASSTIAKIQNSLQDAQKLAQEERLIGDFISRHFVAAVFIITTLVAIGWSFVEPERVFEITLAMLIAACPCAFSLATPLGRAAATNCLKRAGVLLTNNNALNKMASASLWCFDKTGTLTKGRPTVSQVITFGDSSDVECLEYVAALEQKCTHVLAQSFRGITTGVNATDVVETIGCGVQGTIDGEKFILGKPAWVVETQRLDLASLENQQLADAIRQQSPQMLLAKGRRILALIFFQDELRSSSVELLRNLKRRKLRIALLSGDSSKNVDLIAQELGIAECHADYLPSDKLKWLEAQKAQGDTVVMVGDGINDAPVLAAADVAVAMASGSDLAMQNADVVLLNGRLDKLLLVPYVATRAIKITRQNLAWALLYNSLALPLAAAGLLTPWIAALGMSLSSLIVVLNATRIRANYL